MLGRICVKTEKTKKKENSPQNWQRIKYQIPVSVQIYFFCDFIFYLALHEPTLLQFTGEEPVLFLLSRLSPFYRK